MHPYQVRLLRPVGETLRLAGGDDGRSTAAADPLPRVIGVLVVGPCLSSHFWLSILPLARDAALRCFIRLPDLQVVSDFLHVRPTVVPAFMVMVDGYFVDAFPAPLPDGEPSSDPASLIRDVRERLRQYG